MQMRRDTPWVLAAACCLMILAAACGGARQPGTNTSELAPAPAAELPWPPPEGPARAASDFMTQLNGSEWTDSGGSVVNESSSLRMSGAAALPWAIYTVAQLGVDNELTGILVMFDEEPGTPGDGTALFVGLANYELGAWEWFDPPTEPFSHSTGGDPKYRSPAGTAHVAVALAGGGEALVNTVTFTHTGDTGQISAPENLTGEVLDVELVELDWDDVEGASGYNVYRSRNEDLSLPKKVNDGLVVASEFTDEDLRKGYYHWYWVTAVASDESARSNVIQLWAFEINLPAPTNLRVTDRGAESFKMAWDWDLPADPSEGWFVYVHTEPDFLITDDEAEEKWVTRGDIHHFDITGREPGVVYYWKVCARASGYRGRISEEATGSSAGYWTWADVETIAEGQIPLSAVRAGDEMGVAYFNGIQIDVAVRDQGTWTSDGALVPSGDQQYTEYLDLAYADDTFLVASYDGNASDAWAAYGTTGSWTRDRIHGDGVGGLTLHGNSGHHCRAAAGGGELAVIHHDVNGDDIHSNPEGSLKLHTRPISGGSWTTTVLDGEWDLETTLAGDLAYLGTNLYVLWMRTTVNPEGETDPLLIGDRDGGWSFIDVRAEGVPELSQYMNLLRFDDEWYATAFHGGGKDLYILNGTTPSWTEAEIAENLGYYAKIAAEGSEAIAIFYGGGQYYFARYSKGWAYERISVPGTTDCDSIGDILLIGGVPHFFFRDEGDGMIKVARGSPPEE